MGRLGMRARRVAILLVYAALVAMVVADDPMNQIADLTVGPWSTTTFSSCFPPPVPSKTLPMPADHSFGLDDDQCFSPLGPQTFQQNPQDTIMGSPLWSGLLGLEHAELLAKSQVLKGEVTPGLE